MSNAFFPVRGNRIALPFVSRDWPAPLAVTYARIHDEMDRQEPVAAAWQLRDAFECLLKFCAYVAAADFLQADPSPEQAQKIVAILAKENGLWLDDWFKLLEKSLQPLKTFAQAGKLAAEQGSDTAHASPVRRIDGVRGCRLRGPSGRTVLKIF